jgi:hypothetical protein
LAPGIFEAYLMHLILRILKLRFLRVATLERFFEVLLFRWFSWPEIGFIVFRRYDLV